MWQKENSQNMSHRIACGIHGLFTQKNIVTKNSMWHLFGRDNSHVSPKSKPSANPGGNCQGWLRSAFTQRWWINDHKILTDVSATSNFTALGQGRFENPSRMDQKLLVPFEVCWKCLGYSGQWWDLNSESWFCFIHPYMVLHVFEIHIPEHQ